jgi:membrane peptidoglycan carboxypeptidase
MLKFLKYVFFFCLTLSLLAAAAVAGGLYYFVVVNPGPEIEQSNIESILGRESPVFYSGGQEKIGVLFQGFHRQYLSYGQIPGQFIQALVAAEDNRFFHHYGVDPAGIVRAMIANFKAGRVVQGGSTLTQQTAKNLFKRQSRSYEAKLKELLYALRLEYHYPKEKILEFYSNQFFVSGNGHGLGVAARYYFNKNPAELSLLECAFIAGSVKRPNYYNPFIKKNKQQADLARKRADQRAGYVLRSMLREEMITRQQYEDAIGSDIVFNQGRMAYALNTVMDLVKDGLSSAVITNALEEHGISNVSTSGVRIITSIDHDLQEKTLYALRKHLCRLDVRLRGYDRKEVLKSYADMETGKKKKKLRQGDFLFGTILSITTGKKGEIAITVSPGGSLEPGTIDREGLDQILSAFVKHRKKRWSKIDEAKDLPLLLAQLRVGDRVYVSVRDIDLTGIVRFDLERYPELEGAALVMKKGAILAMAGGMENRYFNRAIDARRLMGSTFKPFVFTAAMQLGWNAVDMLDNRRNVFVFMDRPYFPRPDHHSPFDRVSMSWAGVKSENVAAVWLLYHLTDYLTPPRLREVAAYLDMAPRSGEDGEESYRQFSARIRDAFGIQVNRDTLNQAAYERAVKALEADFLFEDRAAEYAQLQQLPYGLHFDQFLEPIQEKLKDRKLKDKERRELRLRVRLLNKSYLRLRPMLPLLRAQKDYFEQLLAEENSFFSTFRRQPLMRPEGVFVEDERGRLILTVRKTLPEDWHPFADTEILNRLRELDLRQTERFWKSVQLEGAVCACTYDQVQAQMERERLKLLTTRPYSMEVLSSIRDYRIMLGLQYLIRLGRAAGIESRLAPVLSFPLGSNVVSLAELVRMYETLVTGFRYDAEPAVTDGRVKEKTGEDPWDRLSVIDRIETPEGRVIYARNPAAVRIVDVKTAAAVTHILQNVVSYGTGNYAWKNVRLQSPDPGKQEELEALDLPIPLLGKTGTANRFRNSAFVGYVPVPAAGNDSTMVLDNGYAVGAYVGYDKNRPMRSGTTHVTGSVGGLPIWSDMALALLEKEQAAERFDPVDLTFNGLGLRYPDSGQLFVPVDPKQGGAVLQGRGGRHTQIAPGVPVILSYGIVGSGGHFEPARLFRPFWMNSSESTQ